ncbi:hydantoinase/oxoprolinase family protein [Limnochorda pilosa]|uniref:Hydantoinase n=1 Tax=Limnochorda pilosa TaxID=1555112 RepID=A0A0K2SJS7_LIMPI|nr:hydantoinase/oxoprolinase family protein [Limnochorda pilosa]BAS27366.1 hydantoinase [Limnochorda pilosa]
MAGTGGAQDAQKGRRVRIGIDVGGTFTDAVAIDDGSLEILAQLKIPTTHSDDHGVAAGVVRAVRGVLEQGEIDPSEVVFISHGTTQATNALLEGDVVTVGVVGMGTGLDGARARGQTQIEPIPLAQGKVLHPVHTFVETGNGFGPERVEAALRSLIDQGAEAVVAAEAYSVDDPQRELQVQQAARELGLPGSSSHEISKRYGLKMRTRTAVINASILPRMTRTADMTEESVQAAGIAAPLMIMRGDGGSMMVDEMRRRPILTLLSGPAAGVAGALMYAKVSDGLFLEVGGTSTDISLIKNGRVMVDYAEVGGHRTYLRSLDVRTVGVAGGSMIRIREGRMVEVGPRSAHIAGLAYAVFSEPEEMEGAELEVFAPLPGDPAEYVAIRAASGKRFALTLSDAANLLGLAAPGEYAHGNVEAARRAWGPLARVLGTDVEEAARQALELAAEKVLAPIHALRRKYALEESKVVLVGGGGGSAAVVPYVAGKLGVPHRIVENAPIISTIGVALAMIRETIERSVSNPTEQDLLRIRREAQEAVIGLGAEPSTVEVQMEVLPDESLVRAVATGATELRTGTARRASLSVDARRGVVAQGLGVPVEAVEHLGGSSGLDAYGHTVEKRALFGLLKKQEQRVQVCDQEGVVRLKLSHAFTQAATVARARSAATGVMERASTVKDTGRVLPNVFVLVGSRLVDLSGIADEELIHSMIETELAGLPGETPVVFVAEPR